MSYIGRQPTIGNFQICDAISVVNNQAAYTMQVSSVNVEPETANHMIVSLNGVIQKPNSSFTISGSTITFASNLVTGDVINFIQILGNVLDLGVPSDGTVSTAKIVDGAVTSAKLASGTGGKVLQVVSATDSTSRSTTSTSFVTGSNTLSVNITPSSTSSKIFLMANGNCYMGSNAAYVILTIYRNSTDLGAASNKGLGNLYKNPDDVGVPYGISFLDSPSTTSQITYQVYFRVTAGTGTLNENSSKASLTAFEVGA